MNFVGSRNQLINLDQVRKLQHFEDGTIEVTYSNGDIETIAKEQQSELYEELVQSIRAKGDPL
jgi:DNA-binding LytR/AlgR family response regulator